MAAGLLALLLAGAAPPSADPLALSLAKARVEIVACGIPATAITVEDNALLQEEVIRLAATGAPSDERLRCVARASVGSAWYVFFPEPIQQRYWKLYWQVAEQASREASRKWLADRGLLDKLPRYEENGDLADYGRRLEAFCGLKPGSYLEVSPYDRVLTPSPPADWSVPPSWSEDAMTCIFSVTQVSGVAFGFIGNAAEDPPPVQP